VTELSLGLMPALQPPCRLTVAIPARDEALLLGNALSALAAQRSTDGRPLAGGAFDLVVFANNCRDATVRVARAFALANPAIPTTVVHAELPPASAHVGMARKLVMDLAAARFIASGRPRGLVATTDADTVVDSDWVAATLQEAAAVDAVAGHVVIAEAELATLFAPVRLLYARERAYRRALADVSAALDPLPHDPAPRHASFVGASFAVAAETYRAAGGLPPLEALEDLAFSRALCRIDARVRHSLLVRAQTSPRRAARVSGGFGTFVADLHERGTRGATFSVQHPRESLDEIELRAAIRSLWRGSADPLDVQEAAHIIGSAPEAWLPLVDGAKPFGAVYDAVRASGEARIYEPVPVEWATAALRIALAARNAPSATRISAASGAG
jgi:hypothetical protein